MKQKKEKKLALGKVIIQVLDKNERQGVQGGFKQTRLGTTQIPIYC